MEQNTDLETEYIRSSITIDRPAEELFKAMHNPKIRKEVSDNLLENITIEKTVENSSVHWKGMYEEVPYFGTILLQNAPSQKETKVELVMSFSHETGLLETAAAKVIAVAGENIAEKTLSNFKTMMEN
jgi:uncharacterized membrane protein